jgi:hypothetical protein
VARAPEWGKWGARIRSADHWRPSQQPGGSPGERDTLSVIGFPSLLHYALTAPLALTADAAGGLAISSSERLGADQTRVVAELSDDLITWTPEPGDGTGVILSGATTSPESHRSLISRSAPDGPSRRFIRLRVESR